MRVKFVIIAAGLIIGLASACSTSPDNTIENQGSSSSSGDSLSTAVITDFESCSGLLDVDDVREAAGRSDVEIAAPNVNSGTAPTNDVGMKAMCIYEYVTPEINVGGPAGTRVSGPSMTLTGILFDSPEDAEAHYQLSIASVRMMKDATNPSANVTEGTRGDESYLLTVNAERVGSMVGVRVGPYIMSLHTTLPDDEEPIVGPDGLASLASMAQERITSDR